LPKKTIATRERKINRYRAWFPMNEKDLNLSANKGNGITKLKLAAKIRKTKFN
jgi:hypothetical protein